MLNLLRKVPHKCLHIMEKIASAQAEVYLVGGSVRDLLLQRPSKDWDIVTNMTPEGLLTLFPSGHYHGKSFGVFSVKGIEISTFRSDDGTVSTLYHDLSRRDFTFNAMAFDLKSTLIDPFGGHDDLLSRTIGFVENPCNRIKEDPCRMLRGIRFVGLLGGKFDASTKKAIQKMRLRVHHIAKERVRGELMKIMACEHILKAFDSMCQADLLELVIPPLYACMDVDNNQQPGQSVYEHSLKCTTVLESDNPLLRLAALLHDVGKPGTVKQNFEGYEKKGAEIVRQFLTDLRFSTAETDYITELVEKHSFNSEGNAAKPQLRRFLSQLKVPIEDFMRLRQAESSVLNYEQTQVNYHTMRSMIAEIMKDSPPLSLKDLRITGQDLMELGLTPGPFFSEVLHACLDKVLEEPSLNKKPYLKEFVRNYAPTQHRTG